MAAGELETVQVGSKRQNVKDKLPKTGQKKV